MADPREDDPIDDKPMPLLEHLIELRRRLIWSMAAFLIAFFVCYYFSKQIYVFLAQPLADILLAKGGDRHMIFTALYEAFFHCAMMVSFQMDSFEIPEGTGGLPVQLDAKVGEYLDLVMKLIFAFGITFELPVLLTLLAKVGIVTSASLKKFRRYAYVGMFVVAAILAPPDVITQVGLAVPLILLYEISILTARMVEPKPAEDKADA